MSEARRTELSVSFDGVDITASLEDSLLSLTYIDSEEDEADDLQIKLEDRAGVWLREWLPEAVRPAAQAPAPTEGWKVGDSVTVSGRPQYSSYGIGAPGRQVSDYHGKITYLNLKSGIPYPIHVDYLGWFAESQVQGEGGEAAQPSGLKIRASITRKNWERDGRRRTLPCGEFQLDSIDASGPPSVITLKASALPLYAGIRRTKRSKAWESYTLSGIAGEIAAANGMVCLYQSPEDPCYDRVAQENVSDIEFLSGLCHDAGLSLKVTDGTLVLFDQALYEEKEPAAVIAYGGGYTRYRLDMGASGSRYASCRVSYVDPSTGQCIEATVKTGEDEAKGGEQLEVSAKVAGIGEAEALAKKLLRLHNKFARTASFTLPGDPALVAGVTVLLEDWGIWDGKYIISRARHTVSSSGYTTQVDLRKVLEGY